MRRIVTIGALVLVSGLTGSAPEAQSRRVSSDIEELLWWLPSDTETVQVTQTPANPRGPLFEAMELVGGEIPLSEDIAYSETLARHLKGARIKTTVEGSR